MTHNFIKESYKKDNRGGNNEKNKCSSNFVYNSVLTT